MLARSPSEYQLLSSSMSNDDMEGVVGGVSELTKEARAKINVLIERAERQTGSRMAAYHMVAQQIGCSSEWVRCFARGYPNAKICVVVLNINEAYRRAVNADGA